MSLYKNSETDYSGLVDHLSSLGNNELVEFAVNCIHGCNDSINDSMKREHFSDCAMAAVCELGSRLDAKDR